MKRLLYLVGLALCFNGATQAQQTNFTPQLLIPVKDFNKIIPTNIAAEREVTLKPYLLRVAKQQQFLTLNKTDFSNIQITPALPSSFDWRDQGMVTSVKNQQQYGTCWAFSLTAAIESNYLMLNHESMDMAEQDLINCGCRRWSTCGPGNGTDLGNSFSDNLKKNGIGTESDNPYTGDDNNGGDCTKHCGTCNQTVEKSYGIDATEWMTKDENGKELSEYDFIPESVIKKAVLEHGPLNICLWIPPSSHIYSLNKTNNVLDEKFTFTKGSKDTVEYFTTNVSYLPKNFKTTDPGFGGHLLLLIGWDDSKQAWLLKNSWGTGSGDNGYIYVKYRSNYICSKRLAPQWVKARTPDFFTTSVWRKDSQQQIQVYDYSYDNYRKKYDELWPQGWRLQILKNTVKNNQVRYSAVWRKSNEAEIQVYGWNYTDFRKKYDELWPQGYRLRILDNVVLNGKVLYTAVWTKTGGDEIQVYEWNYADYRKKYDELWPQGYRLKILNNFLVNGKTIYNAVWTKTGGDEIQVYEWNYADYRKKYDELWPQGYRLKILTNFVVNGIVKYTAVFTKTTAPEIQAYTWPYADFRNKDYELRKNGWSLVMTNVY